MKNRLPRILVPMDFQACFPLVAFWVKRPVLLVLACMVAAIPLGLVVGPVAAGAVFCLATPLVALGLESRLTSRFLLPPFTSYCLWGALGLGIGVPLYSAGLGNEWARPYFLMQLVYLLTLPLAWAGYWLGGWRKAQSKIPKDEFDFLRGGPPSAPVLGLAWVAISYTLVLLAVRLNFGFLDQGYAFVQPPRWAMVLGLVPRLDLLGFFFLPLAFREARKAVKIMLGLMVLGVFLLAMVTGNRGTLLYPALFLFSGGYFFRIQNSKHWQKAALTFAFLAFAYVTVVLFFRANPAFGSAHTFAAKIQLFSQTVANPIPDGDWRGWMRPVGYSFFGVEDAKVYANVPRRIPLVGWDGFSAIPWTWIPSFFVPDKPLVLDADVVAGSVQDPPIPKMVGHGISLSADAYRRFGWWGVVPAVLAAFVAYGWLAGFLLTRSARNPAFQAGCLAFVITFFQSPPLGTLLTTWHTFAYNIPKNILALWLVCHLIQKISPAERRPC